MRGYRLQEEFEVLLWQTQKETARCLKANAASFIVLLINTQIYLHQLLQVLGWKKFDIQGVSALLDNHSITSLVS